MSIDEMRLGPPNVAAMRIVRALLTCIRWFYYIVWGGLGALSIVGFVAQTGNDTRPNETRFVLSNIASFFAIFGLPLSSVAVGTALLRRARPS